MTARLRHPFNFQWDKHYYRDTARLKKIRSDATGHDGLNDTMMVVEQFVTALHAYFINPISKIEWHDGIVVLRLRMPNAVLANIALNSFGDAHYLVRGPLGYDEVTCPAGDLLIDLLIRDLIAYGLQARSLPSSARDPSLALFGRQITYEGRKVISLKGSEKRTATANRMTLRYTNRMDEPPD